MSHRIAPTDHWKVYASAADANCLTDDPSGRQRRPIGLHSQSPATVMVRRLSASDTPQAVGLAGGEVLPIRFHSLEATDSSWTNLMVLWESNSERIPA